jgi:hypothetical protein
MIPERDNIKVDSHIVNSPNSVMWSAWNELISVPSSWCVLENYSSPLALSEQEWAWTLPSDYQQSNIHCCLDTHSVNYVLAPKHNSGPIGPTTVVRKELGRTMEWIIFNGIQEWVSWCIIAATLQLGSSVIKWLQFMATSTARRTTVTLNTT